MLRTRRQQSKGRTLIASRQIVVALFAATVLFCAIAAAPDADSPGNECAAQAGAVAPRSDAPRGRHSYFEMLVRRRDCLVAYSLRGSAELDRVPTRGKSEKKQPITYDAAMDAARVTINAQVSTDTQQKLLPVPVKTGSLLLTWEFRFDKNFRWETKGDMVRHKTWRLDPGPWLAFKTDYQRAAHAHHFAELFMSLPSRRWLAEGTTRGNREILFPRAAEFFFEPDTWTRAWLYVEDIDRPVCRVSLWAADERRDPVRLYDRIALTPPKEGVETFRIEYDTSADHAANAVEAHSWNRNVVALHDITPADVAQLLQRPTR